LTAHAQEGSRGVGKTRRRFLLSLVVATLIVIAEAAPLHSLDETAKRPLAFVSPPPPPPVLIIG